MFILLHRKADTLFFMYKFCNTVYCQIIRLVVREHDHDHTCICMYLCERAGVRFNNNNWVWNQMVKLLNQKENNHRIWEECGNNQNYVNIEISSSLHDCAFVCLFVYKWKTSFECENHVQNTTKKNGMAWVDNLVFHLFSHL